MFVLGFYGTTFFFFLQSRLITLLVDPDMMHQFPSIVNQKGQNKQTM